MAQKVGNRKAAGRRRARQAMKAKRQAARQARKMERVKRRGTSGRGARKLARQQARFKTKQARIAARERKQAARQAGRSDRTQSKAAGGFYTPESTAARWGGIASLGSTAATLGAGIATGGASLAAGGLDLGGTAGEFLDVFGGDQVDQDLELSGGGAGAITDEPWFWPAAIGGGALVVYLATRKGA